MNVSAMEGKFYRHKDVTHPHTNMAKVGPGLCLGWDWDHHAVTVLWPTVL